MAQQLLPLRAGAVDAQPPLGQLVGDLGEGLDQARELLLVDQPAGRHHERVVEARARGEAEGQRVRDDRDLGGGVAELLADPVGHRGGEDGDDVGARGEVQQRLEPGRPVGGRAVLLVHDDGLGREQLDGRGQQPGGDRDEDVELEAGQHVLEPDVAQRGELAVPRVGDDERVARVQRPGLRRSQLDTGHRRVLTLAHVDQVADLDPLVDPVVRPVAAAGDRQQGDGVVAGQRVGLGDRRPGGAAHAVEVEDQVADLHAPAPFGRRTRSTPSGSQRRTRENSGPSSSGFWTWGSITALSGRARSLARRRTGRSPA